jgi:hypothetical protein
MSPWRDTIDWVGGYPFEVAKPEEVIAFCRQRQLEPTRVKTCGRGRGCNEFVLRRGGVPAHSEASAKDTSGPCDQ